MKTMPNRRLANRNTLPTALIIILITALITTALTSGQVAADHMEELVITARHDSRIIDVSDDSLIAPDVTELLKRVPGAQVNSNGPLTGIPQYRGMYGSRIATTIDGTVLAPAGPNWMDPPLSYAISGQLEALEVYRGIAPVGVAQESIGGAIQARTRIGEYAAGQDFELNGRVIGSAQSASDGYHLQSALYAANNSHRIKLSAMTEAGDDARFPDGKILPTEYERQRYDVGYGWRHGPHQLQFDYGYNDTGDAGTPALPMDILYIESDLYRLSYRLEGDTPITLALFGADLDHGMSNFHLRNAPADARWRRNIATSDNVGFKLTAQRSDESGSWNFGVDGFSEQHNSDIDNPNNPLFFVQNFNDARRAVLGAFLEREMQFGQQWRGEFGLRLNHVMMDADAVDATPARMMPPATALRDAFNNAEREQEDNNIDVVLRAWFAQNERSNWYLGLGRKSRSPNYQERYLWLPLEATAGLADGNTYTGNIQLNPEVAYQAEFGLDYSDDRLTLSPRIYYSQVDDYIDGTTSEVTAALMFVQMMNNNNGTNNAAPLQFNNVDAQLYGFDLDWALQLTNRLSIGGLVNYVRGKRRDDSNDNLYRISPFNILLRLNYVASNYNVTLENEIHAEQDDVSATHREQTSDGYGLVNLRASWEARQGLTITTGVNNLFDRDYSSHLSGYNRAENPDVERGSRLPGTGVNLFARVIYAF
ncbi:MAG: iron complex outermembrane receptor protein [Bacteroidia bacterium]|jgi:iron complex outermembrane receptor protein